jgi:hypothetical protein
MIRARLGFLPGVLFTLLVVVGISCRKPEQPVKASPAQKVSVHDDKMKETLVEVFPGMDGPDLNLTQDEIRGRVVWNLWVGDSGEMWDFLAQHGFGTADLIKTIDSRRRAHRFAEIGIVNQPGFQAAARPDPYGLFIDEPKPGDPDGQIDQKIDNYTYGRSSGVVGLRISNNTRFGDAAKAEWMKHVGPDGINHDFYENSDYFNDPKLVRPYVVGMACAFCHVGELERLRRRAVLQGLGGLRSAPPRRLAGGGQLRLAAHPFEPAGDARHVVHRHRLPEQPRHDERRLQP